MTQTYSWHTESVRFSLLGVTEGAKVSWHSITGKEAESMTNRPAQQLVIEEGPFEDGRLVVTSQPGRIDITLSAMPSDPFSPPSLGVFDEVTQSFERRLSGVKMPGVARLAFGATLSTFPGSLENSNKLFKVLVPQIQIDPSVSDLMLQFNRPKKLPKVSGVVMNRLTKWAQLVSQTIQYHNNVALNPINKHVIQLELDLNSHPESKLPSPSAYGPLIAAFFTEARGLVAGSENG
ncbi:hypothetical protein ACIGEI_24955 [Pseudomonas sp. NPDC078863]|uniref:hypothetical protein n=1 Tax=Pseudomonas sp. NPDC078863 TaxID=3364425 RepID=UPI0037C6AD1B